MPISRTNNTFENSLSNIEIPALAEAIVFIDEVESKTGAAYTRTWYYLDGLTYHNINVV